MTCFVIFIVACNTTGRADLDLLEALGKFSRSREANFSKLEFLGNVGVKISLGAT